MWGKLDKKNGLKGNWISKPNSSPFPSFIFFFLFFFFGKEAVLHQKKNFVCEKKTLDSEPDMHPVRPVPSSALPPGLWPAHGALMPAYGHNTIIHSRLLFTTVWGRVGLTLDICLEGLRVPTVGRNPYQQNLLAQNQQNF